MWQISPTKWVNPLAITSVLDVPGSDVVIVSTSDGDAQRYDKQERTTLLAFLHRHSSTMPYTVLHPEIQEDPGDIPF